MWSKRLPQYACDHHRNKTETETSYKPRLLSRRKGRRLPTELRLTLNNHTLESDRLACEDIVL